MKILFATSSFGGGGITSYAKEVISQFSKGNDFSVMIGDDEVSPITTPGVKIYNYECSDLSIKNAINVINTINNDIKPDLILSSNAFIISLVSKYLNDDIKIMTISHSLCYEEADMAAISYDYIDKVIAASSIYNKKYLENRFNIDGNKIDVILNFVEELPESEDWMKRKMTNTSPCIISFPGGVSGSKSPDIVLKIVLELVKTDLNFVLYWNKNTKLSSRKLRILHLEDIKAFVNDQRVKFPGRLPKRKDAVDLISSSHIFLAPSRREGCPIALIEAMRTGSIPLVADFDVANKEIIQDGYNGFVIGRNDIKGWVDRISDIVSHPEKYYDIYHNSYKTFKESFVFSVWRQNMDRAIYGCQSSHKKRKQTISKLDIFCRIIYFKYDLKRCRLEQLYREFFLVILEYLKIKHSKNKD